MPVTIHSRLSTRIDHLYNVIRSPKFLQMEGLGNEVPFFICPFPPREAEEMKHAVGGLKKRLERKGVRVLLVDLYDLAIEILKARKVWERILSSEPSLQKAELKELLQNVLDPEKHLVPAIEERIQGGFYDVLFLTGVGEVFPYIRSHTVLNNLQSKVKEIPTVMFFPGDYLHSDDKGASLELFGRLHDANYYRAFNIYEVQ